MSILLIFLTWIIFLGFMIIIGRCVRDTFTEMLDKNNETSFQILAGGFFLIFSGLFVALLIAAVGITNLIMGVL